MITVEDLRPVVEKIEREVREGRDFESTVLSFSNTDSERIRQHLRESFDYELERGLSCISFLTDTLRLIQIENAFLKVRDTALKMCESGTVTEDQFLKTTSWAFGLSFQDSEMVMRWTGRAFLRFVSKVSSDALNWDKPLNFVI